MYLQFYTAEPIQNVPKRENFPHPHYVIFNGKKYMRFIPENEPFTFDKKGAESAIEILNREDSDEYLKKYRNWDWATVEDLCT